MTNTSAKYEFWKEYPQRDPQAVAWYPCTYSTVNPVDIWGEEGEGEKEIGIYIHVPLCKGLCKYCPFNKYMWSESRAEFFVESIKKEIEMVTAQPYFKNKKVIAGYFGGGTPTSLHTHQLIEIIEHAREHFDIIEGAEMTIEANPDTVDEEKLRVLKREGINRVSFGIQSFDPRFLHYMGRSHQARSSYKALEAAHKVNFDIIGIDLMYRVPGQTLDDWRLELSTAVKWDIDHITTFSLFIDPGTRLFDEMSAGKILPQPEEETELEMSRIASRILERRGYEQYSLYDFARPGGECLHHAINWQAPQRDYAGFGPGAFSFLDNGNRSAIYCNISNLEEYGKAVAEKRSPVDFGKFLSIEEEMSRYMVLGVNFLNILKEPFRKRFGLSLEEVYGEPLAQLKGWGLIDISAEDIRLTTKGRLYLANVSKAFFTPENRGKPHVIGVELQQGQGRSLSAIADVQPNRDNGAIFTRKQYCSEVRR